MGFFAGTTEVIRYSSLVEILTSTGKEKLFAATFEEILEVELAKWSSIPNPTCLVF